MPLRAVGINFHFLYEAAPLGAPGGPASALPGAGASAEAAPARARTRVQLGACAHACAA